MLFIDICFFALAALRGLSEIGRKFYSKSTETLLTRDARRRLCAILTCARRLGSFACLPFYPLKDRSRFRNRLGGAASRLGGSLNRSNLVRGRLSGASRMCVR